MEYVSDSLLGFDLANLEVANLRRKTFDQDDCAPEATESLFSLSKVSRA
jgi:hypothetical protein